MQRKTGSVERALGVLRCFDHQHTTLSLTAIASQTGLYKSTVLRLTESLVACGFLIREDNKAYRLGPSIGQLGKVYQATWSVEKEILPFLYKLREKTQESTSYLILRGNKRVCQLQVNSKHRIRLHLEQGEEISIEGGASARILRAWRGDDWEGCEGIKECGWAISAGERDPEVASAAIAIVGQTGKFYGAIAVSGPVQRFDEAKRNDALTLLQEVAEDLRTRLS